MSSLTDWLSALANVTVAGSVVYVARQAAAAVQQATAAAQSVHEAQRDRSDDHVRSRRQGAVDLLHKWNDTITVSETCAMFLVNSLDEQTALDFKRCLPVKISDKQARNLELAMAGVAHFQMPTVEGKSLSLDSGTVVHVGQRCMRYISLLEVILIGWRYGTADREILEEQLAFLVKPEEGLRLARNFRVALGLQNYPNIEQFVQEITARKTGAPGKKPLLGT